jgi:hypothetical protein
MGTVYFKGAEVMLDASVYRKLWFTRQKISILPSLQVLQLDRPYQMAFRTACFFLLPTLKTVEIQSNCLQVPDHPNNEIASFYGQIQKHCRDLAELKLYGKLGSGSNLDELLRLEITTSEIYPFHTDVLLHLSSCDLVTRLEIGIPETAPSILSAATHTQFFRGLKHLRLVSTRAETAKWFIRSLTKPALVTLKVQLYTRSRHEAWMHLFQDLADSVNLFELKSLSLEEIKMCMPGEIDPTMEQLGLAHIRPLFPANKLRSFILSARYGATGVSDKALLQIAAAWPALEDFHLNNFSQWSVTAFGLAEFARHSKSLQRVTLGFESTIPPDWPSLEENINRMTVIRLEHYPILESRIAMKAFFQKNFPRLKRLELDHYSPDSSAGQDDWEYVQRSVAANWAGVDYDPSYE